METLFVLALPVVATVTLAAWLFSPLLKLLARRHKPGGQLAALRYRGQQRRLRRFHVRRETARARDEIEASHQNTSPYAVTPLSDELTAAVFILLALYGRLGVDPDELATELEHLDLRAALRPVARIKIAVDQLARQEVSDQDLSLTTWAMELSTRLHDHSYYHRRTR